MTREKELVKNTIILAMGTFLPRILGLVTTPILTKHTTDAGYGFFNFLTGMILSLIVPLCTLQLEQAFFRFLIDAKEEHDKKRIISSGMFFIFFILILTGVCCALLPIDGIVGYWKIVLIIYLWIEILCQMTRYILRAFSMYKQYSLLAASVVVVNLVALYILLVVFHLGHLGALLALVIADIFGYIYGLCKTKYYTYISWKCFDFDLLKEMLGYAFPFISNQIAWYINMLSDQWILIAVAGYAANGVYGMANKIPSIVNILYPAFNLAWVESATRSANDGDSGPYYERMFRTIFGFLTGGTACLIAITPFLFSILNKNPALDKALLYTPILIIATYFYCFSQFFSSVYIAKKQASVISRTTTYAAILNVVLNIIFVHKLGVLAAVLSTLISNTVLAWLRYHDINKHHYRMKIPKKMVIFCTIVLAVCTGLSFSNVWYVEVLNIILAMGLAYFLSGELFKSLAMSVLSKLKR